MCLARTEQVEQKAQITGLWSSHHNAVQAQRYRVLKCSWCLPHTHHTWNLQQWSTSYAIDWGIFLSSWLQRLTTIRVQVTRISFLIHSKSKAQHSTKFPHITTVSALLTIDSKKVNTRLQSKQPFTLEICCDSTLIMQNLIRKASCYSKPTTKRFMS